MVLKHGREQSLRARRPEVSDRPGETAAVHRLRALQRLGQDLVPVLGQPVGVVDKIDEPGMMFELLHVDLHSIFN